MIYKLKCVFASMVLGVLILSSCYMYFLKSSKTDSLSICFGRNYKRPSSLTSMSFKVKGNFKGDREEILNNRTILKKVNIVHVAQRQNKNKPITA